MKRITAIALLLAVPLSAQAEPKKPWWKDWRSLVVVGAAVGSSLAATHEIHDCRLKGRIELCPGGGYGPFPAREAARGAMTFSLVGVSLGMRHASFKEWVLPSLVATGINTAEAAHAGLTNIPSGGKD
jgi:hypothetical protein